MGLDMFLLVFFFGGGERVKRGVSTLSMFFVRLSSHSKSCTIVGRMRVRAIYPIIPFTSSYYYLQQTQALQRPPFRRSWRTDIRIGNLV